MDGVVTSFYPFPSLFTQILPISVRFCLNLCRPSYSVTSLSSLSPITSFTILLLSFSISPLYSYHVYYLVIFTFSSFFSSLLFHLSSLFLSCLLPRNIHIFRCPVLPTKLGFSPFTAMGKSTISAHISGTFLSAQWIADSDIESKGKEMKYVLCIPHSKSSY